MNKNGKQVTSQETIKETETKKKNKPPSKIARDRRRLLKFITLKISKKPSTTDIGIQVEQTNILNNAYQNKVKNSNHLEPSKMDGKENKEKMENQEKRNQLDPKTIYPDFEEALMLRKVEEPATLLRCLRHVTRCLHPRAKEIIFPYPEALDRFLIKSEGITSEPAALWKTLQRAFTRRNEQIEMESLYEDFVKIHGKRAFDPGKTGSDCFYITHIP